MQSILKKEIFFKFNLKIIIFFSFCKLIINRLKSYQLEFNNIAFFMVNNYNLFYNQIKILNESKKNILLIKKSIIKLGYRYNN